MGERNEGSHSAGGRLGSLGGLPSTKPGGWSVSGAGAGAASSKIPLATEPPESCVSGDWGPLAAVKSSSLIEAAVEWAVEVTEGDGEALPVGSGEAGAGAGAGANPSFKSI